MKSIASFALLMTTLSTPACAYFLNGDVLYNQCLYHRAEAIAMVLATADAYVNLIGTDETNPMLFCVKPGISGSDATDIVCRYLADHPDSREKPACTLVFTALNATFPCGSRPQ